MASKLSTGHVVLKLLARRRRNVNDSMGVLEISEACSCSNTREADVYPCV